MKFNVFTIATSDITILGDHTVCGYVEADEESAKQVARKHLQGWASEFTDDTLPEGDFTDALLSVRDTPATRHLFGDDPKLYVSAHRQPDGTYEVSGMLDEGASSFLATVETAVVDLQPDR